MKIKSWIPALAGMTIVLLLVGCGVARPPRGIRGGNSTGYTQDQFASRLEYLRFCDHYYLYRGDICVTP